MKLTLLSSRVSLMALAVGCMAAVPVAASAAPPSVAQMQKEINELQAQINALNAQQTQLHEQQRATTREVTETKRVVVAQATTIKQVAASSPVGGWHAVNNGTPIPDFKNDAGSEFTLFGQVDLDTGLASVPITNVAGIHPSNNPGFAGAANFKRVELGLKGVYDYNFPFEIQEDWTKTSSPLAGLLDVWLGYQNHTPFNSYTIFKAGNQHVPFGFQTPSSVTFDLENEMGNSLFQDGRELGLTGQSYNKHFNFWYGAFTTAEGASCSNALGSDTIVPGKCYTNGFGITDTSTSTTTVSGNKATTITTTKSTANNTAITSSQFTLSYDFAWNFINTPGHLLSIRNSNQYNRFNGSLSNPNNQPTLSTSPDLGITGEKFISTGALPIKSELIESPRIDFEDGPLTLAAVYYDATTSSDALVTGKKFHFAPHFSSWDVEGQLYLTDDHELYSDDNGYYVGVKPNNPINRGGLGAIQITGRVDEADLSASRYGIYGGNETNVTLGAVWVPVQPLRFDLNYVHTLPIGGAQSSFGANNTYRGHTADAVALRLEVQY
jgi:phosphate-selective porin OprO/OprP